LTLIAAGVEHSGALIGRNCAQIAEGAAYSGLAIGRESLKAPASQVGGHAVLRGCVFQSFSASQAALALIFRQLIDPVELLHEALLFAR
jgi:hypothetical protein